MPRKDRWSFQRRRFDSAILAATFLALACASGCVKLGPDFVRPEAAVSGAWLEADDERVGAGPADYRRWWQAFQDPVLDSLIDRSYRENLSLRIAGVRVLEARAQLGIAIGGLYPQSQFAAGSLMYNRLSAGSIETAGSGIGGLTYAQSQAGLNATWELDFWGRFRRSIESADAAWLASVANYDNTMVSLTADVANNYILIRSLEKRIEIALQNVGVQREGLKLAEARYRYGTTTQLDVEQAKTVLENTLATVPLLETQLRQAKDAIGVLLGLPPAGLKDLLDGPAEIPVSPLQVVAGIPADLIRRRPDIRSAEYQAAAQCARIGVAKADLYPAFSLNGMFGFLSTDIEPSSLGDTFKWKSRTYQIGPSFQWNILNYGQITNNVRLQDALFQELLIAYQNTVLTAQQDVEDNLIAFLKAQERADFLAKSAAAAKRSLDLAFFQYREGIRDFTAVLSAQQALLTEQDNLASTLGNLSTSLVGVYRALGGAGRSGRIWNS